jgi:hypothetical protein
MRLGPTMETKLDDRPGRIDLPTLIEFADVQVEVRRMLMDYDRAHPPAGRPVQPSALERRDRLSRSKYKHRPLAISWNGQPYLRPVPHLRTSGRRQQAHRSL